ncbi:MAG: hypothetical protein ACX939_04975 [Hyphococcus sp.]
MEMDILFDLSAAEQDAWVPLPSYLAILIKRAIESELLVIRERHGHRISVGNIQITPDMVLITQKGRQFVSDLGVNEL